MKRPYFAYSPGFGLVLFMPKEAFPVMNHLTFVEREILCIMIGKFVLESEAAAYDLNDYLGSRFPKEDILTALKSLLDKGCIHAYPGVKTSGAVVIAPHFVEQALNYFHTWMGKVN